jgi:DNA-binding PadR family transcriptional regulator
LNNRSSDAEAIKALAKFSLAAGTILLLLIALLMVGCPQYKVYTKTQSGKAQLEEARQNRQIAIEEAQANLEAERLNAQAEIERAKGAAESIKIEGGRLTDQYIKYLWVRQQGSLNEADKIYIPTEAGLPLLEARK